MTDFFTALSVVGSVVAVVVAWCALARSGQRGPRGPQGLRGETYYPMLAVHEVKPGSVIHLHNVDFGDEDGAVDEAATLEIMKAIGHTDFVIVRTEGDYDSPGMVGVWPEGEFADRVRRLFEDES